MFVLALLALEMLNDLVGVRTYLMSYMSPDEHDLWFAPLELVLPVDRVAHEYCRFKRIKPSRRPKR